MKHSHPVHGASSARSHFAGASRGARGLRIGVVATALLGQACVVEVGDDSVEEDVGEDGAAFSAATYTAPFLATAPSIDGALGEYASLPVINIAGLNGAATVRGGWDAQALYLAYDVTDSALFPSSGGENQIWNGDSVEVMFDTLLNRSATADQDDYHLLVSASGQLADSRSWTGYSYASGATVRAVTRTGGYRIEMKIPFGKMGVTPAAGKQLGFDVVISDRDVSGGAITAKDFAGLTKFNNPAGWGTLVLAAAPPPPVAGFSCPTGSSSSGALPNGTAPGVLAFPNPTLRNISVDWKIDGDANANGQVSVHYRAQGSTTWKDGMPLRRVPAGATYREGYTFPNRHAGSIFDLEPATTYELELMLKDPDGGCQVRTSTVTTRPVPAPMAGAPVKAVTPSTFASVAANALPGDILELAAGSYAGFTFSRDGQAGKPIVIRAKGARDTVVIGGNITFDGRSHVHLVGVTVNGTVRFYGAKNMAFMKNAVNSNGDGFVAWGSVPARDAYIADNVIVGPTLWNEAALGVDGANLGEGVRLMGPGHVIEHNYVRGFRDGISFVERTDVDQWSIDVIENDIEWAADDGIEADFCQHNCRILRNRITNSFMAMSSQPSLGGPTYFIRNNVYNAHATFKLLRGSVGDVILHNSSVKAGDGFSSNTTDIHERQYTRNNLFLGGPGGTNNGYSSGTGRAMYLPAAGTTGDYDYDGFGSTTGSFSGRVGSISFASFSEMLTKTTEKHGVWVGMDIFATTVTMPSGLFPARAPADLRLRSGAAAVDKGLVIPNINDGFAGTAPDLGCFELGATPPTYGPR